MISFMTLLYIFELIMRFNLTDLCYNLSTGTSQELLILSLLLMLHYYVSDVASIFDLSLLVLYPMISDF